MKTLPLKGGKITIVDDADYDYLSQFKWHLIGKYVFRAVRISKHFEGKRWTRTENISMHREIIGAREGEFVDHIDCDPLNNTRGNLRICTARQNICNRRVQKSNKLGVKGVFLNSEKRMTVKGYKAKYRAKCKIGGIVYLDNSFHTIEEAKAAYDACAQKHQGEFSRS